MKWRDKLELNEIKKSINNDSNLESFLDSETLENTSEYNIDYKKNKTLLNNQISIPNENIKDIDEKWNKFNSRLKKTFKNNKTELFGDEQDLPKHENPTINEIFNTPTYKKVVFEKDISALAVLFVSFLGVISIISPGEIPAVGRDYILGIDIDLWWILTKILGVLFGSFWCLSLVWKLRGISKRLEQVFKFLPNLGQYSLKTTTILFFGTLLFTGGLQVIYPHIFKSSAEWKHLESLKIDSRDPIKRAEFAGMIKGLDSQSVVPNIIDKNYRIPPLSPLEVAPNDFNPDPKILENVKDINKLSEASKAFQEEMNKQIIERDKMIDNLTKSQGK